MKTLTGTIRKNIQIDSEVTIIQKHHQRTGELTEGFVKKILTSSPTHPHGIKVMLDTGEVGRVVDVIIEEN
ncbi:putative repeat protein (TIGR03833 family) [Algoriphagus ratkowskyi]|uniref:Putative repeat protein (TIGR03833 family) n=1 Tax=Algoriphagus ratkowskyi TaxID=57028 RepID=A0A2W7RST6_9BACT|nr:YwbE family protein [Algoriphagus ratkowskyi]PZX53915.1 putative repeat protein (TIGR03833 family) [Algoriphagus ratkowskyi]TXD76684.1 YwbE family protein [Algoriphagus ratkowskyi]